MFKALLKEAEAATPVQIEETIKHAYITRRSLWWDGYLHRLAPIGGLGLKGDADYIRLAVTYFNCLKNVRRHKGKTARLILCCIADLPDVFNGTTDSVFGPMIKSSTESVSSWPQVTLHDKLKSDLSNQSLSTVYRDPRNAKNIMYQVTNEGQFFKWLIADTYRIRSVLGIISLALLGLHTRGVPDVHWILNGDLYLCWGHLFAVAAPPVKIALRTSSLGNILQALHSELPSTQRVLAMCLKLLERDPHSKFAAAFDYLVALRESAAFSLEHLFDQASSKVGMDECELLSQITVTKTLLSSTECLLIRAQYEDFFFVMRYIAYCHDRARSFDTGVQLRTRFYRYAPLIDKRFFAPIINGNRELRSFFVGFVGGPGQARCGALFEADASARSFIEAGRVCRVLIECPEFEEMERTRKRLEHQRDQEESLQQCIEAIKEIYSFLTLG